MIPSEGCVLTRDNNPRIDALDGNEGHLHSEVFKNEDFADESDDIGHFADRDLSIGTDVVKRVMRMNNSGDKQCHDARETDHFSKLDRHPTAFLSHNLPLLADGGRTR